MPDDIANPLPTPTPLVDGDFGPWLKPRSRRSPNSSRGGCRGGARASSRYPTVEPLGDDAQDPDTWPPTSRSGARG